MPPIDPVLALVCEQLSLATGLPVSVGTASTADGLVLWPWRLVAGDRNLTAPMRGPGGERSAPQPLRVKLSVAVLASSATLRLALAWATDNAVLSIAGDFNNWQVVPMQREGGVWMIRLPLPPGVYNYAFRSARGEWFVPASVAGRRDDGMGGHVAVLVVG